MAGGYALVTAIETGRDPKFGHVGHIDVALACERVRDATPDEITGVAGNLNKLPPRPS